MLDAVASMGFNPLGISCASPFIGHLCLLTLPICRSSVLDGVGSQMGFNPPLILCDPPFIGHLCLTLHFFTGRLCWTQWVARWGSTRSGSHVTLPLQVICA